MGALYDWGSHLIDQILSLHPGPIDHVTCIEHKRKWHDVTNADHTTVSLRFRDGAEAVFVHSDLAAALKPRWYLLGTEGAITSSWRQESVVRRSAVGTLDEDVLAVTDSPPELTYVDPLRFPDHPEAGQPRAARLPSTVRRRRDATSGP